MIDTQQWVAMGYIKGVFGIKGWVKVSTSTEYADSLLDYPEWQLTKDGQSQAVSIEVGKVTNDELQVKFTGIDDRDQAFALKGYTVEILRAQFEEPEDGEYYWADLVGMNVVNTENISLGSVSNLMETGAHDILVINGEYGQKLIPFVDNFIKTVDHDSKTITVDWGTDY